MAIEGLDRTPEKVRKVCNSEIVGETNANNRGRSKNVHYQESSNDTPMTYYIHGDRESR